MLGWIGRSARNYLTGFYGTQILLRSAYVSKSDVFVYWGWCRCQALLSQLPISDPLTIMRQLMLSIQAELTRPEMVSLLLTGLSHAAVLFRNNRLSSASMTPFPGYGRPSYTLVHIVGLLKQNKKRNEMKKKVRMGVVIPMLLGRRSA